MKNLRFAVTSFNDPAMTAINISVALVAPQVPPPGSDQSFVSGNDQDGARFGCFSKALRAKWTIAAVCCLGPINPSIICLRTTSQVLADRAANQIVMGVIFEAR